MQCAFGAFTMFIFYLAVIAHKIGKTTFVLLVHLMF